MRDRWRAMGGLDPGRARGDCLAAPPIADGERLLSCLRVVTPAGVDQAHMEIRGKPVAVEPFAAEPGAQAPWRDGDRALHWRRGEQVVKVDLMTDAATPADSIAPPPRVVEHAGKRWEIKLNDDGKILASKSLSGGTADLVILSGDWPDSGQASGIRGVASEPCPLS